MYNTFSLKRQSLFSKIFNITIKTYQKKKKMYYND